VHVLIVGGTRFVGHLLAWRLLAAGHRLSLLNRGTRPDSFGERIERLVGDRTGPDFARLLKHRQFDAVIDFAAYTEDDARTAVDVLRGATGHYIFISTGQVYLIRLQCPRPARETDYDGSVMAEPVDPLDRKEWEYGIGKRKAEDILCDAGSHHDFPVTRLRIPMVNGERDYYRRLESYIWRLLDGGPVIVPDGGTHVVRHVYGMDVVKAICRILGDPQTFGKAYNLCQPDMPTLRELLLQLAALLGAPDRTIGIAASEIVAAGLSPERISPFSGRWMSLLDATRAENDLGLVMEPTSTYLPKIVASFLANTPSSPPDGYTTRAAELALAR
jgi:nucleoside-diphosphate-sugar epimerase